MKRSLLFGVLSLGLVCSAQTNWRFADSTAEWNVVDEWYNEMGPYTTLIIYTDIYKAESDTTITGVKYQRIVSYLHYGGGYTRYVRRDSTNKIFAYNPGGLEYFLFDFAAGQGDTIKNLISWANWTCPQPLSLVVDSVDSVYIGHWRKRMFFGKGSIYYSPEIWIDGIGTLLSNGDFLSPGFDKVCIAYETSPEVLCYSEGSQVLYQLPTYQSCVVDTSILVNGVSEIRNQKSEILLSPNPATTTLTIQLQHTPAAQTVFTLFDVTGRMILQQPLTATTNRVELNGVSKGMYLYNVVSEKLKAAAGKLIIE